jgi:hypothetical protein
MPLPIQAAPASTMPSGGSNLPDGGDGTSLTSATTPNSPAPTAATATWMPMFQIGVGQDGVPADARGLIAGEQPAGGSTSAQMGAAADKALAAATAAGAQAGQTGPSGGQPAEQGPGESGTDTGTSGGPDAQGGNVGANPSPAATSQAQREQNLRNAYGGAYDPDPNVP